MTACLEDEEPTTTPARVFFVSPTSGDHVGRDFRIKLATTGFTVKPAGPVEDKAGFLTLFIDASCVAPGESIERSPSRILLDHGETVVDISVDAGPHRLCVQASDGSGKALPASQTIEIVAVESQVRIVAPAWGAAIGTKVRFTLESDGVVIEPSGVSRPGAGHFYLVIDEECPPEAFPISLADDVVNLSNGEREIELEFSRGSHEVWVGIADGDDIALAPRTRVQFLSY